MTGEVGHEHRQEGRIGGVGCLRALLSLLAALVAAGGVTSPAAAQQDWAPTVATSPGGTLHVPMPDTFNREPTKIDPRYFPSPRSTVPQHRNLPPRGAWSPIVTGALPHPSDAAPGAGFAPRGLPDRVVPPLDGFSPVRPTPRQGVAAAGGDKAATDKAASEKAGSEASDGAATDGTAADEPLFKKPGPLEALPPNATAAQQYCFNTADSAADARFAWQAKKIQEMEAELDKRSQQLEAKTEEYKRWLERRDDFSRKAHEKLVAFYSRMRPDAAAVQLASLDEEMAAAVVMKLETKVASLIMGEMDPERAAKIATIISGASKVPPDRRRAPAQAENKPPEGATPAPPAQAPTPEAPKT